VAHPDPRHLATIRSALGAAPGIVVVHDEGMDTIVYETDGWIFRFARDRETSDRLARESRLLDAIADRLPAAIPRHLHRGEGFVGYRRILGTPLSQDVSAGRPPAASASLAGDGSRLLRALHGVPLEVSWSCGLPAEIDPPEDEARGAAERFAATVGPWLTPAVTRRCEDYLWEHARWSRSVAADPVVLHNDFRPDWHIFVDPGQGRLVGVIDFADAATGDPASDLAPLAVDLPPPFLDRVLEAYGDASPAIPERCVRRGMSYMLNDAYTLARWRGEFEGWRLRQIASFFG
jgi:aminoglycoside phosphotransferase (APT) family kinase protein